MRARNPIVDVPPGVLHDIKYTFANPTEAAKAFGMSRNMMRYLYQHGRTHKSKLDGMIAVLYGAESPAQLLRAQLEVSLKPAALKKNVTLPKLLRALFLFVEVFDGMLDVADCTLNYYVFPPRNTLRSLVLAYRACRDLADRIRTGCPDIYECYKPRASVVAAHAACLRRNENGTDRVHVAELRKVPRRAKKRKPGREEIDPVLCARALARLEGRDALQTHDSAGTCGIEG